MTGYAYLENVLPEVYGLEMESIEVSQKTLLSPQQQVALMNLVRVDDPDMKQKMITQNLRLVVNVAKRYSDHGVAFLELVREGIQGLIHALENFEREGGFRFESYAVQCVRRSIEHVIMNQNTHRSFAAF
jgi:DNA-directed RNA polymerase sigma subunit (sigma70/sigma32)